MRRLVFACVLALGFSSVAVLNGMGADDIRLSGCLVRGENGEGYLVTNVPGEAAWQRSSEPTVVPGPVGTSGAVSSIFYWVDEHEGLDDHVGHQVEIEGELKGDLKDGEIKIDRKGDWTDVEIKSDGRSFKAKVPRSILVIPATDATRIDVLVRKVEPKRVRMLAAVCGR
jgi:hypothetical protein